MRKLRLKPLLKTLLTLLVLTGVGGMAVVLLFGASGDFYTGVKKFNDVTDKLILLRVVVFIAIYTNWRFFVSGVRQMFKMGYRRTFALLQCRKLVLYIFCLDIILMVVGEI